MAVDDLAGDIAPNELAFTQQPGPRMSLTDESQPHEFHQLFIDDPLLEKIVDGTNEYAAARIWEMERAGKLKEKSRWRKWKRVTLHEMKRVLAVVVNMRIINCPRTGGHLGSTTSLSSGMSCRETVLKRSSGCCICLFRQRIQQTDSTRSNLSSSTSWLTSRVFSILLMRFQWTRP